MSVPADIRKAVEANLGVAIVGHSGVGGGCIANATRLETEAASYFLKWGRGDAASTFEPEADGLRALRAAKSSLHIPKPIATGPVSGDSGFLLMEWIESGSMTSSFWEDFGRGLAEMHRHTAECYGFSSDNFIGRLPQVNKWADEWPAFFETRRLEPQVQLARERGRWSESWDVHYDRLKSRLPQLLPLNPEASTLHGDLWGGNFLVAEDGGAAILDPAAYYGHREADLGMTRLFGGFEERFYAAYDEAWPLESGSEERLQIYNLYHLINHLNHFGSGYAGAVDRILRKH